MKFTIRSFVLLISIAAAVGCYDSSKSLPDVAASPDIKLTANPPNADKNSPAKLDAENLREWIGKYPINADEQKYKNFFQIPEVKKILVQILKEEGFQKLLTHFVGNDLITEKDGFLVMLGKTAKNSEQDFDYALVALNPETRETHVFFSDGGKLKEFSSVSGKSSLTPNIKKQILIHTDAPQATVIGTLKQKPEEGFQCFATLPKDREIDAGKRPYVFVMTDAGGIFNIAGGDIELKSADSTETKGENGRTYAEWNFKTESAKAKFDLAVEKSANEGADVYYEGTLTVTTDSKSQTIQIKAFCGG